MEVAGSVYRGWRVMTTCTVTTVSTGRLHHDHCGYTRSPAHCGNFLSTGQWLYFHIWTQGKGNSLSTSRLHMDRKGSLGTLYFTAFTDLIWVSRSRTVFMNTNLLTVPKSWSTMTMHDVWRHQWVTREAGNLGHNLDHRWGVHWNFENSSFINTNYQFPDLLIKVMADCDVSVTRYHIYKDTDLYYYGPFTIIMVHYYGLIIIVDGKVIQRDASD